MKTITIGDLHGRRTWKNIHPDDYDLIVFLGDYVDSLWVDSTTILDNFKEVIGFKKSHPQKVRLLIGNHETSYLFPASRASGYRPGMADEVCELLTTNAGLFQIACQYRNYLWTHAGIHQGFYDHKIKSRIVESDPDLAFTLERLYLESYPPIFEIGPQRMGSSKIIGGPLWLDKSLIITKPLKGYHQIIGHTRVETIRQYRPYHNDPDTSVTICDCVEYGDGSFYKLEIE